MKNVNTPQDGLVTRLRDAYSAPLSDAEAQEAASNLLSFMELLLEIDSDHGITRAHLTMAQS